MSDDRLFSLNNPIGRKWYYINIVILVIIGYFTNFIFKNYIFQHVTTEMYSLTAQIILYFLYLVYLITFLGLIDRRLFDLSGDRDTALYKNISGIFSFIILYTLALMVIKYFSLKLPVDINSLTNINNVLLIVFTFISFILGLFKGKITNK